MGSRKRRFFRIIFLVNPEGGRARRQAGTKKAKSGGLLESNIAPKRAVLASLGSLARSGIAVLGQGEMSAAEPALSAWTWTGRGWRGR